MSDMPTNYNEPPPAYTEAKKGVGCHKEYLRTLPAILELVEILLSLITIICASVNTYFLAKQGGGYVHFACVLAIIWTSVLFVLHLTALMNKLPGPWPLIKFASYVVLCVLLLIAAIVCAAKARYDTAIGAATFFAFATLAAYGVDLFFKFREWREFRSRPTNPPPNVADPASPQY